MSHLILPEVFRYDWGQGNRFAEGSLSLDEAARVVRHEPPEGEGAPVEFPLASLAKVETRDRAGLGTLDLLAPDRLLLRIRYTVARARQATAFADALNARLASTSESAPPESIPEPDEIPQAEEAASKAGASTLFRLFRFARNHKGSLILGALLTLGSTAAGMIPPYLTGPLVDDVLVPFQEHGAEAFQKVPLLLLGMLGAAIVAWVLGWGQGWVLARLSERISADLRNTTYEHLQRLSLDYFSNKQTGDLISRIGSDTDRICSFLSDTLTDFVTDIVMIAGTAIILIRLDPILALAAVVSLPIIGWLTLTVRQRLQQGFLHGSRAWADMTAILADTIPGVRVVKAFAQGHHEVGRFRETNKRIVAANDRVNRLWTFFWPMVAMFNSLGLIVVWAVGAWRIQQHAITVGILTIAIAYINRLYTRIESMSRMANATERAAASAQRIFEVLDRAPSVPEPASPVHPGKLKGQIAIRNVSFRFGNRQVVDNVSLDIRPGEMIGLVGPTGSGKSTLLNLVCRFYDVSDGSIRIDGTDVRAFPSHEYRQNIGIVLQDPFLFHGTIAENIAYGRPDATRAEIIQAARAARAHEFILQLSDGYDSAVGERGQTLSGGERQRISIARALLIDPRILILDEATSAVDTQTERQIQEALDELVKGRTTIAIAHRLSTLSNADRLVVFDKGSIVESGRHDELLARGGLYSRLYEAQRALEAKGAKGEAA